MLKLQSLILVSTFLLATACGGSSSDNTPSLPPNTTAFTVTVPAAPLSYNINGVENPALTLQRGQTYTFTLTAAGHPFWILTVAGTNTRHAFSTGVTGNGTQNGTVTFVVPVGAPNTLFYNCSAHAPMGGTITVTN